jgi:hypothetical protein
MTNMVFILGRHAALAGGIDSWESSPGLLKCLQIRSQYCNEMRLTVVYKRDEARIYLLFYSYIFEIFMTVHLHHAVR